MTEQQPTEQHPTEQRAQQQDESPAVAPTEHQAGPLAEQLAEQLAERQPTDPQPTERPDARQAVGQATEQATGQAGERPDEQQQVAQASGQPGEQQLVAQVGESPSSEPQLGGRQLGGQEPGGQQADGRSGDGRAEARPMPRPMPRPVPRPVPKPGGFPTPAALGKGPKAGKPGQGGKRTARPRVAAAEERPAEQGEQTSPVPEASASPGTWGRVAEDGAVFLLVEDGERQVGSWQAGAPDEGLAHFARRFDDLRTEAELLHARLASGSGDAKQAATSARHLKATLAEAAVVGDVAALAARIEVVLTLADASQEQARKDRDAARADAVARKETLAAEAEQIAAEATQWKAAGDRLRTILDEWKTVKGIDRKTDDALWKRFSKARENFNRRRGAHFAELDKQRGAAKERKTALVAEAEKLADSTDWGPAAGQFRALMADWKAAGPAPKGTDDALWDRFRGAQDKFFAARSAAFSERDAEFGENAKAKEALLAEAQKLDPGKGVDAAKSALRGIQDRWEKIGKVPRERIRELEDKFKAIEDKFRAAEDARWRRTDPEAQARAAQFAERVAQFEAQAAKARAAGDDRRAARADEQAAQWREWQAAAENAVADR